MMGENFRTDRGFSQYGNYRTKDDAFDDFIDMQTHAEHPFFRENPWLASSGSVGFQKFWGDQGFSAEDFEKLPWEKDVGKAIPGKDLNYNLKDWQTIPLDEKQFPDFNASDILQFLNNEKNRENIAKKENDDYDGLDDEWAIRMVRNHGDLHFIEDPEKRKTALLNDDSMSVFPVNQNLEATDDEPLGEVSYFNSVKEYEKAIDAASKEYGVDPDLLKAIVYMETSHGYYDIVPSRVYQTLGIDNGLCQVNDDLVEKALCFFHKSILPMNINTKFWGDAFGSREQLNDPAYNIFAGAEFLRRLSRLAGGKDASIAQIATLYNDLAAKKISNYGKRAEKIYNEKIWNAPNRLNISVEDLSHQLYLRLFERILNSIRR